MKKITLYIIFLVINLCFITSCESDDICADKVVTPRLIIRVYDKNATSTTKNIQNLLIFGKDNKNKALQLATTDSIVLPLKMLEKESTFILVKNAVIEKDVLTAGETTELKISYQPEQTFANKGCGYKVIYKNISAEKPATSWISSVRVLSNDVENENKAAIHIFY